MKEACGVFGVWAPGRSVSRLAFDGLYALQHRGQESAGMATSDGEMITVVKDMGLVTRVFDERVLAGLTGHLTIGHTRYSTHGASAWNAAQPVYRSVGGAGFAVGHNGNLINTPALVDQAGILSEVAITDSEVMAEMLAQHLAADGSVGLAVALRAVLPMLEGAYSLVLMDTDCLYGARDPHGLRPLCLGRLAPTDLGPEGWVLASESPALDVIGAQFVRELDPGELLVIGPDGVRSEHIFAEAAIDDRLCVFEFVYFARPDAQLLGREVYGARYRMGELLAQQGLVDADLVIGVPDSGVPAAEGFARQSGIPYGQGLVKNRYIGRTFIEPTVHMRDAAVRRKLNPLRDNIDGRRLVVVDDSIVRGTNSRAIVRMLREAGAQQVHLRISSPPFRWPCYYGIDTPTRSELLAAQMDVTTIAQHLGADSVEYLNMSNLRRAIGVPQTMCDACLTGHYVAGTPVQLSKRAPANI